MIADFSSPKPKFYPFIQQKVLHFNQNFALVNGLPITSYSHYLQQCHLKKNLCIVICFPSNFLFDVVLNFLSNVHFNSSSN